MIFTKFPFRYSKTIKSWRVPALRIRMMVRGLRWINLQPVQRNLVLADETVFPAIVFSTECHFTSSCVTPSQAFIELWLICNHSRTIIPSMYLCIYVSRVKLAYTYVYTYVSAFARCSVFYLLINFFFLMIEFLLQCIQNSPFVCIYIKERST